MRIWLAFTAIALLAGCDLYFGGDDEPPMCNGGGRIEGAPQQFRDPNTGTCFYGPWWNGCDDTCGPCPAIAEGVALPNVGLCQSQCTNLPEYDCKATAGCYADYVDDPAADGKRDFLGCWQTAPSGPIQGSCVGLDAYSCSSHDDCAIVYEKTPQGGLTFGYCATELYYPGCYGSDCAPGYHCEEQCTNSLDGSLMGQCQSVCVPDSGSCAAVDCGPGYTCVESCEGVGGGLQCGPQCVPTGNDPGSCTGFVACDANPPACPAGTSAGILNACWTGYCIPNSKCGPNDPGACTGTVTCSTPAPSCPSGTTAGIANGCYTGYCIPSGQCPLAACSTLPSESACTGRDDCVSVYTGTNCTCYPYGCSCQTLTYDHCESAYMPL